MQKVSFNIPGQDGKFGSYISKYPADSEKVQPNMLTSGTRNVVTSASGQAEKRSGGAIWNANSLLSAPALDQYEGIFGDGTRLFVVHDAGTLKASSGNGVFASIQAGFTNPTNFEFVTYANRVYGCNGVDSPICIDRITSYGGVTYAASPAKSKTMGAQAPSSAPTAARATDSTAGQIGVGSHTYKVTYLYYNGAEESNGSAASAVCANDGTHTSNDLSALPVGGYGVTARKIYRDNNDGAYTLLATIQDNTTTTYTDKLSIGSTPTPIPTLNFAPGVFKYVALYLDRLFTIDITGKTVSWSMPGEPDVYRPQNTLSGPQDDVMTSIYIFNGIPWVFGQHTVGTILGSDDGSFYYNPVSTTVGCVDNRTIQTRSIISVPTLLWLAATPNKGIYYTNGSIVQYLSDYIEDLTFNLAQISYLSRMNTQNSQSAFQGGTASPGVDLTGNPGTVQTVDPVASWSRATDWATGVLENLAVNGDQLSVPVSFAPAAASGSLSGAAQVLGANIKLSSSGDYTGGSRGGMSAGLIPIDGSPDKVAFQIQIPRDGTFNGLFFDPYSCNTTDYNAGLEIYSDALGLPASRVAYSGNQSIADWSPAVPISGYFNVHLVAGTYWLVLSKTGHGTVGHVTVGLGSGAVQKVHTGAGWVNMTSGGGAVTTSLTASWTFTSDAASASGSWASPVYDSKCSTQTSGMSLAVTASYPAGTSATVTVQGSADRSSWNTTDTLSNPSGTVSLTGGAYKYWQVLVSLASSDNRVTPSVTAPLLAFNTTGTWTSAPVLCTSDTVSLDSLVQGVTVPTGCSATVTVATSATIGSGYSSFVALASATPNKYAKVRVVLTTDAGDTVSSSLLSAELGWTVTANLVSSAIDTGATPSGWGIFQWNQYGVGGTVAFYFRSAATSGALAAASWSAVINGGYPTASPLEFCQWKIVLTASAGSMPEVNSVTVNWYLSSGANIRAASLFFNKSYYLSVASQGSTYNDTLIELDYEGNWRVHSGLNIGAMGLYFNDAFNCDSRSGKVFNMFKLPTDNGTNIVFDMRTKHFVIGDDEHLSVVRSVRVKGVNTGTTIHAYYSVDKGQTWYEMLNSSGVVGYTTTNDGSYFNEYFVVNFGGGNPISGTGVIYRIVSSDQYACKILKVRPTCYVRKGKVVNEAM